MSLRTKILAALVGLNLVFLLLGVLLLVVGVPPSSGVPPEVLRLASRAQADPGPGPAGSETRSRAVEALRDGPEVEAVVWLEEADDPDATPQLARRVDGPPAPESPWDARAMALHRRARIEGRAQVLEGEALLLLEGGCEAVSEGLPREGRQSLYVRWSPAAADLGRVRVLYATLLAGILGWTAAAWVLLSRLVVRPLRGLATAAGRMAAGDLDVRLPEAGSDDEFARTARAFNRMAGEVAEYQSQLEDRVMEALGRVRKAEQHLAVVQRLAATGKLASGIAHEINNPLGGMRNAVRALLRGDLDAAKTAEYLDLVQDGLARVEETVKKILAFTPRSARPRPTDMADVVRKAAGLARHRLERRGVRYEERLPGPDEARVYGDPQELQQVVLNLLLNAADAIPEGRPGGGRVEAEVRVEGEAVVVLVRDDGVGMTPEVQAECFDLFFTTKEVGEGTGLGLAVVHTIVTNHGGRVDIESAPGQGTTFRVVLPRETGGDTPPAESVTGL